MSAMKEYSEMMFTPKSVGFNRSEVVELIIYFVGAAQRQVPEYQEFNDIEPKSINIMLLTDELMQEFVDDWYIIAGQAHQEAGDLNEINRQLSTLLLELAKKICE